MVSVRFKTVALVAYLSLIIPIACFFLGWLKLVVGIPAMLILVAGFLWLWQKDYAKKETTLNLPIVHLAGIAVAIILWVILSGSVGFFKSAVDIPWRTACFRDLITYDWPVIYPDTGYGLSYYVTFWLPLAALAKVIGIGVPLPLLCLLISHYVMLAYLLMLFLLRIETPGKMWGVFLVFMFWSGLCALGEGILALFGYFPLNGSIGDFQRFADAVTAPSDYYFIFRSNYGVIQNVYNQVPMWSVILLVLENRRPRSFMFLGLVLLAFSPWGTIGIVSLMVFLAIPWLVSCIRGGKVIEFVKDVFSPANLSVLVTTLPVFYLFLFKAGAEGVTSAADGIALIDFAGLTPAIVATLVLFYVCEFGVYGALIGRGFKRSTLFWGVIVTLVLVPFVRIGSAGWDFCLNVSIPAFFTLMILVASVVCKATLPMEIVDPWKALSLEKPREERACVLDSFKRAKVVRVALAIALCIGSISPLTCIAYESRLAIQDRSIVSNWNDGTYSFAHKTLDEETSLVDGAARREGLFYELIAR